MKIKKCKHTSATTFVFLLIIFIILTFFLHQLSIEI